MKIERVKNLKEYSSINTTAPHFRGGQFLQSWQWGDFLKNISEQVLRVVIKKDDGKILGKASIIIKKPYPFITYAYIPYGPLIDYSSLDQVEIEEVFKALIKFLSKFNCLFIRFDPPLLASDAFTLPDLQESQAKTKQPSSTLYLDLSRSQEDLLKEMKSKTRYNIKLSGKKGLVIKKEKNEDAVNKFLKLLKITGHRNKFSLHDFAYYQKMIKALGKNLLTVYSAYYQDRPLASIIVISFQDTATYLHGASSNTKRNLMSTYLLQWQAILDAQKQNFSYYDFWGIDEKKWPGVTKFKLGFGGTQVKFHPSYEVPVKKISYFLYRFVRKISRV